MSEQSWKDEFYPIEATEVEVDDLEAVNHSLQKWIGLRKENLQKHEINEPLIAIGSQSCALCHQYIVKNDDCIGCPLFRARIYIQCDERTPEEITSPWNSYKKNGESRTND